jgi:hypothetical protein
METNTNIIPSPKDIEVESNPIESTTHNESEQNINLHPRFTELPQFIQNGTLELVGGNDLKAFVLHILFQENNQKAIQKELATFSFPHMVISVPRQVYSAERFNKDTIIEYAPAKEVFDFFTYCRTYANTLLKSGINDVKKNSMLGENSDFITDLLNTWSKLAQDTFAREYRFAFTSHCEIKANLGETIEYLYKKMQSIESDTEETDANKKKAAAQLHAALTGLWSYEKELYLLWQVEIEWYIYKIWYLIALIELLVSSYEVAKNKEKFMETKKAEFNKHVTAGSITPSDLEIHLQKEYEKYEAALKQIDNPIHQNIMTATSKSIFFDQARYGKQDFFSFPVRIKDNTEHTDAEKALLAKYKKMHADAVDIVINVIREEQIMEKEKERENEVASETIVEETTAISLDDITNIDEDLAAKQVRDMDISDDFVNPLNSKTDDITIESKTPEPIEMSVI